MGNLIIKGKGGAGNKLILQDQAGAAVLTTADSGVTIANASLTAPTIANMANCTFPAGHILQVKCGVERDIVTSTTQNWSDISSDLTVSITLSSASNKVLCQWNGQLAERGGWQPTTRLVRNQPSATTIVTAGTSADSGSGAEGMALSPGYSGGSNESLAAQSASFLDSPNTTNAIEYKVQWFGRTTSSGTNKLNTTIEGNAQDYYGAGVSSLTLFEVKV